MKRWMTAAVCGLLLLACGEDDEEASEAPSETTTAPSSTTAAASEPVTMPTWCTPATPADVQTVEAALTGTGNKLTDAFVVEVGDYRYVVANVDDARGERLTSGDVWVVDPTPGPLGGLFAASGGARDYSVLPDFGTLSNADPFGSEVSALMDCLAASAQQRNAN